MRDILVKLADKFDQEGKHDLASEVDILLTTASRPHAPLKSMDDEIKKDLLRFIHNAQGNISASMESLSEFFRRLRYFDQAGTVKDLRLDRTLRDLQKIQNSVDGAGKALYALSYGKHPSKADLEQMADDFGPSNSEKSDPLEFFDSQQKTDKTEDFKEDDEQTDQDEESLRDYEEEIYEEDDEDSYIDIDDEDIGSFWEDDEE